MPSVKPQEGKKKEKKDTFKDLVRSKPGEEVSTQDKPARSKKIVRVNYIVKDLPLY